LGALALLRSGATNANAGKTSAPECEGSFSLKKRRTEAKLATLEAHSHMGSQDSIPNSKQMDNKENRDFLGASTLLLSLHGTYPSA